MPLRGGNDEEDDDSGRPAAAVDTNHEDKGEEPPSEYKIFNPRQRIHTNESGCTSDKSVSTSASANVPLSARNDFLGSKNPDMDHDSANNKAYKVNKCNLCCPPDTPDREGISRSEFKFNLPSPWLISNKQAMATAAARRNRAVSHLREWTIKRDGKGAALDTKMA